MKLILILLAFSLYSEAFAEKVIEEPESELKFKTKVTPERLKSKKLTLSGLGCREKTIFAVNIYAIAHFVNAEQMKDKLAQWKGKSAPELKENTDFYKDLCQGDFEKLFILVLVRDVSGSEIEAAFKEGIEQQSDANRLSENAKKLLKHLETGVSSGDKITFRFLPGGKLRFKINEDVNEVYSDKKRAQAVWRIWFCENPTVGKTLRNNLIKEIERVWK